MRGPEACIHSTIPASHHILHCMFVTLATACREGLDFVVSQAAAFGLKLIMTLTNYYVSSTTTVSPCACLVTAHHACCASTRSADSWCSNVLSQSLPECLVTSLYSSSTSLCFHMEVAKADWRFATCCFLLQTACPAQTASTACQELHLHSFKNQFPNSELARGRWG